MGMFMHWTEEDSCYAGLTSSVNEYGSLSSCRRCEDLDNYPRYKEKYNPIEKTSNIEKDVLDVLIGLQIEEIEQIALLSFEPEPITAMQCTPYEPKPPKNIMQYNK